MLARLSESIGTFLDLRRVVATAVVATALLLLVPFVAGPYLLHLLTISLYYVILAASWNLLAVSSPSRIRLSPLSAPTPRACSSATTICRSG